MSEQPLFDFGTDPAPVDVIGTEGEPTSRSSQPRQIALKAASVGPEVEWHEVPQARFLSWSCEMQDAYCRARDLYAAATEDDAWHRDFHLKRAGAGR